MPIKAPISPPSATRRVVPEHITYTSRSISELDPLDENLEGVFVFIDKIFCENGYSTQTA